MTGWLRIFHCECRVQEQDALLGPTHQTAFMHAQRLNRASVTLNFFENISQTGRDFLPLTHRKSQAFCLPWSVVRVLAQDDHAHFVEGRQLQRLERRRGVNRFARRQRRAYFL